MKLALFDLDGTLYNTNDINYYAYKEALEKYNVTIDYKYYCDYCNGRHYTVFIPSLVNDDMEKVEDVHKIKKNAYSKYLDKVKVNEHLFNIIELLKSEYKIAIVTTASKKNTMEILEFTNKKNIFDYIITAEDIEKPKPDPEGFNKVIRHFNIDPKNVIIFEDSEVGIQAAKATGATVFVVSQF